MRLMQKSPQKQSNRRRSPPRARPEHDGDDDDHMPGARPWLSPTAHSTHWHQRTQRLAAERRANAAQREADVAGKHDAEGRKWDPDPPPF